MIFLYKTHQIEYEYIFSSLPKTLLFLHGWGGNKDSFLKAKKILSSQYNTLTISFPPKPDAITPLDMYDYKNIVINILNLLNISSFSIICHSFGMRVSLMLATSCNIEKIIITGGAGIKLKPKFLRKLNNQFNIIFLKKQPQHFIKFASNDYKNLSPVNRLTFKNIVNKDLTNYIPLLKCPAFLFWGKLDKSTPIKMFKIFKNLKPDIEYKIVQNGDHFCYLKHSETFVDCCQTFLNY